MQLLLFLNESFKSDCNIEFGFTLKFTKFVIRTIYMNSDALVVLVLLLFLFTPARGLDVFWNLTVNANFTASADLGAKKTLLQEFELVPTTSREVQYMFGKLDNAWCSLTGAAHMK